MGSRGPLRVWLHKTIAYANQWPDAHYISFMLLHTIITHYNLLSCIYLNPANLFIAIYTIIYLIAKVILKITTGKFLCSPKDYV